MLRNWDGWNDLLRDWLRGVGVRARSKRGLIWGRWRTDGGNSLQEINL